jgi:uncharacterized protein (TIGR02145 family)
MKCFKLGTIFAYLGILILANCSHDIEELPDTWEEYAREHGLLSSSSDASSSSAELQDDVFCQVGGACITVPEDMCSAAKGKVVLSCGTDGISSSSGTGGNPSGSSSSAKLPEDDIYCQVGSTCHLISETYCSIMQGTVVQTCGTSSSSSGFGDSSSSGGNSSSGTSSSSRDSSSESQGVQIDGNVFTDLRDGNEYKFETAPNGSIWMSENLNYSRGGTIGYCYGIGTNLGNGANSSGCDRPYGRTYTHAMAIDGNSPQGVCPSGWHLPSVAEWQAIGAKNGTVMGTNGVMSSVFYVLAGNYNINASYTLGWKDRGTNGFYWTSGASNYFVYSMGTGLEVQTTTTADYFSVRCVKNDNIMTCNGVPFNIATQGCDNGVVKQKCGTYLYDSADEFCSNNAVYPKCNGQEYDPVWEECTGSVVTEKPDVGTFTDSRNNKTYRWVKIGTQKWMAENMNYQGTGNSMCHKNISANCDKYGRLYDWVAAMNINYTYSSTLYPAAENHQGVCPSGWHIPSSTEWDALITTVGGSSTAGKYLKATSGWNNDGDGLDTYGFSALPGGGTNDANSAGDYGYWWSASQSSAYEAYDLNMSYNSESASRANYYKSNFFSVRCVGD